MDFPIFHLDYFGNRLFVAVVAILHVFITHGLAVGLMPIVAWLEWKGTKDPSRPWDELAYKILKIAFIITTTVGALTCVGIWFAASLSNPYSIGSLIRVFFWAWFIEWIVFITEVCLILLYYQTWKTWQGEKKGRHLRIGIVLAVFSWITMSIIVAILAFMMDPGSWHEHRSLLSAFFNPIYLPQLAFRTSLALVMASCNAMVMSCLLLRRNDPFRVEALRFLARVCLFALPFLVVSASWYYGVIPQNMKQNIPVALATQAFSDWYTQLKYLGVFVIGLIAVYAFTMAFTKRPLAAVISFVPSLLACSLLASVERIREFVRKPFVIGEYMYANGLLKRDYPLYQRDGILAHSSFVRHKAVDPSDLPGTGRDVFAIACTRCHTTGGVNGVVDKFETLFGRDTWDEAKIVSYLSNMHGARPFMPPFPGNDAEMKALGAYIKSLQKNPRALYGAQDGGISIEDTAK